MCHYTPVCQPSGAAHRLRSFSDDESPPRNFPPFKFGEINFCQTSVFFSLRLLCFWMAVRAGKVDCYLSECLQCHAINKECDKSDGASDECLSVKGKHTSNRRKVGLLELESFVTFFFSFLEQMGHFVTNSIWVSVCLKNVCVIHWFSVYLSPAASRALCEQEAQWLCSQGFFNAFPCHCFFFFVHQ